MSKNLFNKIVLFAVVFFLILLAPSAINTPSQTAVRAICTGLAIDKGTENQQVEVTAQILIPEAGGQYTQKVSLVTHDGNSLEDALERMAYQVGKKIRFAHCCYIILSNELCQDNVALTLDYLMRGNNLGNNTLLIHTDKKAKELLNLTTNINSNEVDNLQVITKFNEKFLFNRGANLKSFYADYLSPHQTSYMANITVQEETADSSTSGSGSESSSSSGSGGEQGGASGAGTPPVVDKLTTDGSIAIFYKGKCASILSFEEREYFSWLDNNVYNTLMQIQGVTDQELVDATLSFTIAQKRLKWQFDIVNGTPTIKINYDLGLRPEMIIQGNGTSLPVYNNYISEAVQNAVASQVSNAVQSAMKIQKEHGFDVFNFYKSFNIKCHNEWQKYLQSLDDKENYMQNIEVFTEVSCHNTV